LDAPFLFAEAKIIVAGSRIFITVARILFTGMSFLSMGVRILFTKALFLKLVRATLNWPVRFLDWFKQFSTVNNNKGGGFSTTLKSNYSVLRLLTGFATDALIVCKLIVTIARRIKNTPPENITHQLILVL